MVFPLLSDISFIFFPSVYSFVGTDIYIFMLRSPVTRVTIVHVSAIYLLSTTYSSTLLNVLF